MCVCKMSGWLRAVRSAASVKVLLSYKSPMLSGATVTLLESEQRGCAKEDETSLSNRAEDKAMAGKSSTKSGANWNMVCGEIWSIYWVQRESEISL